MYILINHSFFLFDKKKVKKYIYIIYKYIDFFLLKMKKKICFQNSIILIIIG